VTDAGVEGTASIPLRGPVVAIDGAAGSGKSTLARGLALALGLPYLNTGLMYRALTRAALDLGIDLDDGAALADLTRTLRVRLSDGHPAELEVDGYPSEVLHTVEVDAAVSRASRHPTVRSLMRDAQRELAADGAVVEGRDIGTVVCPDASVKLYLRADDRERAARRTRDRQAGGSDVARDLRARDERDATVNPHEPAADAVTIDTSDATPETTLASALEVVRARL
jgi:CMP/dCMP kinase